MPRENPAAAAPKTRGEWAKILAPYRRSDDLRGAFEVGVTLVLYALGWVLAVRSLEWGPGYTFALAIPQGLLLCRLFALQHEMGHRSVFKTRWLNDLVGSLLGVLTITPYFYWRRTHAYHHATSGNLDERRYGDIDTWTVREYQEAGPAARLGYRLLRHPAVLLTLGAAFQFGVKQRWPWNIPDSWKKEWRSVHATNLAIAAVIYFAGGALGYANFFALALPPIAIGASVGVWLFYMQHQYEDAYWARKGEWNYVEAALRGSSYYDLPAVLHWFTANIGYHHIHHLDSAIPCYQLRRCMAEVPALQDPVRMTLGESLCCARWRLWDEEAGVMVAFEPGDPGPAPVI